jgi:hypothetical protein
MLPSFHDEILVGYEIDCEARKIKLHIKPSAPDMERAAVRTAIFSGVLGYHFENDAFGNIIFALESVPMTWFVSQNRRDLAEAHRFGALGTWASDLDAAPAVLSGQGIQAFILSASLGLTGWVLAKDAALEIHP